MLNYRANIDTWLRCSANGDILIDYIDKFGFNDFESEPFYTKFISQVNIVQIILPETLKRSFNYDYLIRLLGASFKYYTILSFEQPGQIYPQLKFDCLEEVNQSMSNISELLSDSIESLFFKLVIEQMALFVAKKKEDDEMSIIKGYLHQSAIEMWNQNAALAEARIRRNKIMLA